MFQHILFFFFDRGQRSSTSFSFHPPPAPVGQNKKSMRSFLWIRNSLSFFSDCHFLLGSVQVPLLLKAHTPALALPMEREVFSFKKGKTFFH